MLKYILALIFAFLPSLVSFSQNKAPRENSDLLLSDSAEISFLINSPTDKAVYTMYGHAAIRVKDIHQNLDVVFNYGVFDFNESNFIYRFVKGETYYWVEPELYSSYIYRYMLSEVEIVEQILNLTQEDKQRVWMALYTNALPENKVYLYNFFYDNCATRLIDIVSENISESVVYPNIEDERTFRDLIHECVHSYPWIEFGIDMVIGSPADKVANSKDRMFLPGYLRSVAANSTIVSTNLKFARPLVLQENIVNQNIEVTSISKPFPYPLLVGILLLLISLLMSTLLKNKILNTIFDFLLFFVAGIAGCIIFFLMFFSIHPCMIPNWNIVWLNPLMLVVALLIPLKVASKYIYYYHFINFVILVLFVLAWFLIPQALNIAFLPYILTICVRAGRNVYLFKKNKASIS